MSILCIQCPPIESQASWTEITMSASKETLVLSLKVMGIKVSMVCSLKVVLVLSLIEPFLSGKACRKPASLQMPRKRHSLATLPGSCCKGLEHPGLFWWRQLWNQRKTGYWALHISISLQIAHSLKLFLVMSFACSKLSVNEIFRSESIYLYVSSCVCLLFLNFISMRCIFYCCR